MIFSALFSIIPLVAALPASQHSSSKSSNSAFGVIAARSGSPIHLEPLTASGSNFWLGGKSATYCPSEVVPNCPNTTETVIYGEHYLDVEVPGGQAIYVDPRGALRFTQAHSAYEPTGSSQGPFVYTPPSSPSSTFGHWSYTGAGASGFMACPVPAKNATAVPFRSRVAAAATQYQVFAALRNATVPTGNVNDCLGFDALAIPANSTKGMAWQYI